MSVEPLAQMQYLELIKFVFNGQQIGSYWQKFSGGELTVAMGKHKPAGFRHTKSIPGRYEVGDITLERVYEPSNDLHNLWTKVRAALGQPGETNHGIEIVRVMRNSPGGAGAGLTLAVAGSLATRITYFGCRPIGLNFGDGDVTSDDGMIMQQFKLTTEDFEVETADGKKHDTRGDLAYYPTKNSTVIPLPSSSTT